MALPEDDSTKEGSANESADAGGRPQRGMISGDEIASMGFMPRVRWRLWIPVVLVLVSFIAAYRVFDMQREAKYRARLLSEHAMLTADLAPNYRAFRSKVERLAFSAVGNWQGNFKADGFTRAELLRTPVLYGRVRLGELHRIEDIDASIRRRYPDQVASCAGLEVQQAFELYRKGDFLMPGYIESVRGAQGSDRIRALRGDLEFRLRRDTAPITEMMALRYFVLSVDEAALSIDGPTRVYVWDLRTEQLVLRARGEGQDSVIVPVRIAGMPGGGQTVPQVNSGLTLSLHDCSIAAAVRQQLGDEPAGLPHAPVAAPVATDAATGDGTAAPSAEPSASAGSAAPSATAAPGAVVPVIAGATAHP